MKKITSTLACFLICLTLAGLAARPVLAVDVNDPAAVRKELAELKADDERLRNEALAARVKARLANLEPDSGQSRALAERIAVLDFGNQVRLDVLVSRIGWPGQSRYGQDGALAAFLVVQHAELDYQLKYLPALRAAAARGEAPKTWLALLEDIILIRQGQPQRYGSQVDTSNGVALRPLEDEARLDELRAGMGLEPICTYLARFEARAGKITYPKCAAQK